MSSNSKLLAFAVSLALSTAAVAANPAADRAQALIKANPAAAKADSADGYVVREVMVDADGTEHVRFDRTYRGLPMFGADMVVHSKGGQLKGMSHTLSSNARPNLTPKLTAEQAIIEAGAQFGTGFEGVPTARLVVYARGAAPALAYDVNFKGVKADQTPTDAHYLVDARNGRILLSYDNIHTGSAAATFRTLYSGNVSSTTNSITGGFEMRDPSRGNGYTVNGANGKTSGQIYTDTDNTWGSNTTDDKATVAADAQYGVQVTWDYFKNNHGRNGIANDGKGAYNKVHYGRNYVNAYWSDACFCMTYGDGDGVTYGPLVTLDIAGHEMTHGVTSRSANLVYSGESGGLNEATSDIFGTLVEFAANNASDPADYLVGEKIYIKVPAGTTALRYMYNPIKDTRSPNCYTSTLGSLDVHYSSGVANRFFYLLAEGSGAVSFNGINHQTATCNGGSVSGIGRDAAGAIWYRALTVYMTSSTNYAGARTATLNAATDLFGASSAERAAVAAAWSAVSVN